MSIHFCTSECARLGRCTNSMVYGPQPVPQMVPMLWLQSDYQPRHLLEEADVD